MGFKDYGGCLDPKELFKKMNNVWNMFEQKKIEEPKLKENKNIVEVDLSKITSNVVGLNQKIRLKGLSKGYVIGT